MCNNLVGYVLGIYLDTGFIYTFSLQILRVSPPDNIGYAGASMSLNAISTAEMASSA